MSSRSQLNELNALKRANQDLSCHLTKLRRSLGKTALEPAGPDLRLVVAQAYAQINLILKAAYPNPKTHS